WNPHRPCRQEGRASSAGRLAPQRKPAHDSLVARRSRRPHGRERNPAVQHGSGPQGCRSCPPGPPRACFKPLAGQRSIAIPFSTCAPNLGYELSSPPSPRRGTHETFFARSFIGHTLFFSRLLSRICTRPQERTSGTV